MSQFRGKYIESLSLSRHCTEVSLDLASILLRGKNGPLMQKALCTVLYVVKMLVEQTTRAD